MKPTIAKILANFGGDKKKAESYCLRMADEYTHLRAEYTKYYEIIREM